MTRSFEHSHYVRVTKIVPTCIYLCHMAQKLMTKFISTTKLVKHFRYRKQFLQNFKKKQIGQKIRHLSHNAQDSVD